MRKESVSISLKGSFIRAIDLSGLNNRMFYLEVEYFGGFSPYLDRPLFNGMSKVLSRFHEED